jgi:hypothetical protein
MAEYPPFRRSQQYDTPLNALEELMFRGWVAKNNIPFDPNASGPSDYDMRGYYRGMQSGHPMAVPSEINQNDGRPHFTDYYKTPLHQTFSSESQWAGPNAPQWVNNHQLSDTGGRIVFDERPNVLQRLVGGR